MNSEEVITELSYTCIELTLDNPYNLRCMGFYRGKKVIALSFADPELMKDETALRCSLESTILEWAIENWPSQDKRET